MSNTDLPRPTKRPCASCPYRRDVPSGVWSAHEYQKLPLYDGETWEQSPALFYCHQQNGKLCGGWLGCHDPQHLLALRFTYVHPSAWEYKSSVPVFSSGAEAAAHGMRDINCPGERAKQAIAMIAAKRARA